MRLRTEVLIVIAAIWFVVTLAITKTLNSVPLLLVYALILKGIWELWEQ